MIMSVENGRKVSSQPSSPLNRGLGSKGPQKRKPQHEIMEELSESMSEQQKRMTREMSNISKNINNMAKHSKSDTITAGRIHDRLESLLYEQRATNMLLAKLVAINESVLIERDRDMLPLEAEKVRMDTYHRVYRGD